MSAGIVRDVAGDSLEKLAFAAEGNAGWAAPLRHEDILNVFERVAFPTRTCHGGDLLLIANRLGVADIDEMVLRKTGMQRDVHISVDSAGHARSAGEVGDGSSGNRLGVEHSFADNPQTTCAFCDQHGAVGKKGEAERILQSLGDRRDSDSLAFGGVVIDGMVGQSVARKALGRDRNAIRKGDLLLGGARQGGEHEGERGEGTNLHFISLSGAIDIQSYIPERRVSRPLTPPASHDSITQTIRKSHVVEVSPVTCSSRLTSALGLFCLTVPLMAHHSFAAEYDSAKTITVKGVVQKVAWVNPHAYVWVDVKDDSGKVVTYAFESLSPNALARNGWTRNSLKPGDQVTVDGYLAKDGKPLADGSIHANSKLITLSDGRKVFAGSSADNAK